MSLRFRAVRSLRAITTRERLHPSIEEVEALIGRKTGWAQP